MPRVAGDLASAPSDLLQEMIKVFTQRIMGAEVEELRGAAYGEVSPDRVNSRNGYRRRLSCRATRYTIRGYISTVGKHGADVLAALRDAILGHPWMPPIPDPP